MNEIPGFDIRFTEMDDLSYLQEWFNEPTATEDFPFNETEKEETLKNWIGFSRYKASLTGMLDAIPCAVGTLFLMPYRKVAHHCSFYLMVDSKHRKKGIGTSMVRNLLHLAKNKFHLEAIHVEIFEPSPLFSVLTKLDFELFVRQENFVKVQGTPRARLLLEHRLK
jgi:putative acetyltransferase